MTTHVVCLRYDEVLVMHGHLIKTSCSILIKMMFFNIKDILENWFERDNNFLRQCNYFHVAFVKATVEKQIHVYVTRMLSCRATHFLRCVCKNSKHNYSKQYDKFVNISSWLSPLCLSGFASYIWSKMPSYQYRKSHCGDETILQPFYLHNGIPYTDKMALTQDHGPWFNINMSSYQYRKSHCGDKAILRPSYLHNGIFYTGKMASSYWIRALLSIRLVCILRLISILSCCIFWRLSYYHVVYTGIYYNVFAVYAQPLALS